MDENSRKRSANVTEEQKTLLLQYMKKNPCLMSGKFSADFTYKDATILWQKLANILNSCNGVSKDWKSWRKCWQDLRSRSKLKQSKINAERRKTGGGNESHLKLSRTEEATLNLISPVCIEGHTNVKESEVQILPETDELNFEDVEYLEKDMDDLTQTYEDSTANFNIKKNEKINDKENMSTNNDVWNLNESSNDSHSTPIIKRRKRKSHSEKIQTQTTQNLTDIAQKTYETQNSYYENKLRLQKRELELKERLVNAAEKCNPS